MICQVLLFSFYIIDQLERVFLRLGHAETDEQLQNIISKFLPPVLLKLSSTQEGVRKKVSMLGAIWGNKWWISVYHEVRFLKKVSIVVMYAYDLNYLSKCMVRPRISFWWKSLTAWCSCLYYPVRENYLDWSKTEYESQCRKGKCSLIIGWWWIYP